MCPKNINCVALFILPEWIIFEITHFSKMTKILPFSVKKWENCQWNESFGCTYNFLRIRCWIPSLFNNKHWVSFRQQLGDICWLVKNSQMFRNCLYKTSDLIFRFGTKTLIDSSWDSYIIPHRIHVLKTVSHGCGTNRKDIFQFKQSSPAL